MTDVVVVVVVVVVVAGASTMLSVLVFVAGVTLTVPSSLSTALSSSLSYHLPLTNLRYSQRGAWVQSQAILRFLEHAERLANTTTTTAPASPPPAAATALPLPLPVLQASPVHYFHTIAALCQCQGFTPAIALYKEMLDKAKDSGGRFSPHPLAVVPLLQVLSQWGEVTHVSAVMALCEEVVQMATALHRMSDETFLRRHAGVWSLAGEC